MASGYQVKCKFFVPADANDPQSMTDVSDAIRAFKDMFEAQFPSFEEVVVQHRFISRRMAAKADGPAYNEERNELPTEQPEPIPAQFDRRAKG